MAKSSTPSTSSSFQDPEDLVGPPPDVGLVTRSCSCLSKICIIGIGSAAPPYTPEIDTVPPRRVPPRTPCRAPQPLDAHVRHHQFCTFFGRNRSDFCAASRRPGTRAPPCRRPVDGVRAARPSLRTAAGTSSTRRSRSSLAPRAATRQLPGTWSTTMTRRPWCRAIRAAMSPIGPAPAPRSVPRGRPRRQRPARRWEVRRTGRRSARRRDRQGPSPAGSSRTAPGGTRPGRPGPGRRACCSRTGSRRCRSPGSAWSRTGCRGAGHTSSTTRS